MGDPPLVQKLNTANYLSIEAASLFLLQSITSYDVVEKLTTAGILHDEEDARPRLNNLVQLDNVGVPYRLQYANLAIYSLKVSPVTDSILL